MHAHMHIHTVIRDGHLRTHKPCKLFTAKEEQKAFGAAGL